MNVIKIIVFGMLKYTGFFHLSRRLHARGVRILGYHGSSLDDEHAFRDVLFMRPETFRRRMGLLEKWQMNVIPLETAVNALSGQHPLPDHALVLTFDDGWASTYSMAMPVLESMGYQATVYVSTYYANKQHLVFKVLIHYLFWKSRAEHFTLEGWHESIDGTHGPLDEAGRMDLMEAIAGVARDHCVPEQRDTLARAVAAALEVDITAIEQSRMFHFMSVEELQDLLKRGFDLQLHTHRHRLTADEGQVVRELTDNRMALQRIRPGNYNDFCYPSGNFDEQQFPWLRALGIRSATTCNPGFNYPGSCPYRLGRFLDREQVSDLEFEAEICGVLELVRRCRGRTTPVAALTADSDPQVHNP